MPDHGRSDTAELELEFHLDAGDIPRLLDIAAAGRRGRAVRTRLVWHDTAHATLAGEGLALVEAPGVGAATWRIERLRPHATSVWVPGTATPHIATSDHPGAFAGEITSDVLTALVPVAAFDGQSRMIAANDGVRLTLVTGELRAVATQQPVCRLGIAGASSAAAALASQLADRIPLRLAGSSLTAEAYATARISLSPSHTGTISLSTPLSVDDAFAHIVGRLLDVLLRESPMAAAGEAPEPVHRMRVATRRLRSAFSMFKSAVACEALDTCAADLKRLGHVLGPARDWDVFTTGTCAHVAAAFPADETVARMAARAERRRIVAYAALRDHLGGEAFRGLALRLALLALTRPWRAATLADAAITDCDQSDKAAAGLKDGTVAVELPDLPTFASRVLRKRHRRMTGVVDGIGELPAEDLHAIRLRGKQLRYAAEFFAPLFPRREAKRFIRRMVTLQERLGTLNDGAVAFGLIQEIGHARTHAGGIVRGFVAAGAVDSRGRIARAWKRFRRLEVFWD